jgi:UDP-N-acetylglucosamine transferase subunit ALG13
MIFVTVGTNEARFDRLLRAVADLAVEERLVVQHGHSSPVEHPYAESVAFLSFDEMVETIRSARRVITHAGVGSVLVALANGKRPIVVPRRRQFHEAVDDHQLQLGRRFAEAGLVTLIQNPEAVGEALLQEQEAAVLLPESSLLAADLRSFVEHVLAAPAAPART